MSGVNINAEANRPLKQGGREIVVVKPFHRFAMAALGAPLASSIDEYLCVW